MKFNIYNSEATYSVSRALYNIPEPIPTACVKKYYKSQYMKLFSQYKSLVVDVLQMPGGFLCHEAVRTKPSPNHILPRDAYECVEHCPNNLTCIIHNFYSPYRRKSKIPIVVDTNNLYKHPKYDTWKVLAIGEAVKYNPQLYGSNQRKFNRVYGFRLDSNVTSDFNHYKAQYKAIYNANLIEAVHEKMQTQYTNLTKTQYRIDEIIQIWNSTNPYIAINTWENRIDRIVVFNSDVYWRGKVYADLSKFKKVDLFGRHNRQLLKELHPECIQPQKRYGEKLCVLRKYKYTIVVENSMQRDYVTEKIYDAMLSGAIPIYIGAPNLHMFTPWPKAAINAGPYFLKTKYKGQTNFQYDTELSYIRDFNNKAKTTQAYSRIAKELDEANRYTNTMSRLMKLPISQILHNASLQAEFLHAYNKSAYSMYEWIYHPKLWTKSFVKLLFSPSIICHMCTEGFINYCNKDFK